MYHKAVWIGHSMTLEFIREGLIVYLKTITSPKLPVVMLMYN